MACSMPPELDEVEIMAYLEDSATEEVRHHLEKCSYCYGRSEKLKNSQSWMAARLYRVTCPPAADLGDYLLGWLPEDRIQLISMHLSECPHCTRELDQLRSYLASLRSDLEPSRMESLKFVVAHLISGRGFENLAGSAVPSFAGIRGDPDETQLYQAGGIQIAIRISDIPERPGRKSILGLLNDDTLTGSPIYLWSSEEKIAESVVMGAGDFIFEDLDPGDYTLIINSSAMEIHLLVSVQ